MQTESNHKRRPRDELFDQTYLASRAGSLSLTNRIPFPMKLYQMLEDVEHTGTVSIASWSRGGRSFRVHNSNAFVERVMPHYFRQTRYKSFQRQLHLYGFTRIVEGHEKGSYFHPKFLRSQRDLCQEMIPVKRKMGADDQKKKNDVTAPQEKPPRKQIHSSEGRVPGISKNLKSPSLLSFESQATLVNAQRESMLKGSDSATSWVVQERRACPRRARSSSISLLEDPSNPTGMSLDKYQPGVARTGASLSTNSAGADAARRQQAIQYQSLAVHHSAFQNSLLVNQLLYNMLSASANADSAASASASAPTDTSNGTCSLPSVLHNPFQHQQPGSAPQQFQNLNLVANALPPTNSNLNYVAHQQQQQQQQPNLGISPLQDASGVNRIQIAPRVSTPANVPSDIRSLTPVGSNVAGIPQQQQAVVALYHQALIAQQEQVGLPATSRTNTTPTMEEFLSAHSSSRISADQNSNVSNISGAHRSSSSDSSSDGFDPSLFEPTPFGINE